MSIKTSDREHKLSGVCIEAYDYLHAFCMHNAKLLTCHTAFHTYRFPLFLSCIFHPLQFCAVFSSLAFSTPAGLCRIFQSCIFMPLIFSVPSGDPSSGKSPGKSCVLSLWRINIGILTRCAMRSVGAVAVVVVVVLSIPALGTEDIGEILEWVFYIALPNFCFSKALQDLVVKYQYSSICDKIDEQIGLTTFCNLMLRNNQTSSCCPGELQHVNSWSALRYC